MGDDVLRRLLQYRGEIYGFIRAIVRQHHAAEDLFQEVALIIVQKAREEPEIRDFQAWAREIARRKIWQYFRENRDRKELSLPVEEMAEAVCEICEESHVHPDEIRRQQEALRECLTRLAQDLREMLRLRHVDGEGYGEIAGRFQKTEAAVRRAVSRARLALLECIRRYMARPESGT